MTAATTLHEPASTEPFDVLTAYRAVRERVAKAEAAAGREPGSVTLVGAAKAQPTDRVLQLINAGLTAIGENYWQDAAAHLAVDPERRSQWHFIGPVQSNKTADIAERFGWVQSLDRLKIARRLDDQRPNTLARLQVLIQVNISEEPSKSGINPDELLDFAHALSKFPRLKLRGLMAVPAPDDDGAHARLAKHFARLRHTAPGLDTLSMGMTNDLETAVHAGATMVRVGTALFGPRATPAQMEHT